jgi:hypothetical protein
LRYVFAKSTDGRNVQRIPVVGQSEIWYWNYALDRSR